MLWLYCSVLICYSTVLCCTKYCTAMENVNIPKGQRALSKLGAIGGGASSGAVLRGRSGRGLVIIRGEFPGKGFRGKFRI